MSKRIIFSCYVTMKNKCIIILSKNALYLTSGVLDPLHGWIRVGILYFLSFLFGQPRYLCVSDITIYLPFCGILHRASSSQYHRHHGHASSSKKFNSEQSAHCEHRIPVHHLAVVGGGRPQSTLHPLCRTLSRTYILIPPTSTPMTSDRVY